MMQQQSRIISATGKVEIDLVKGWNTKARIYSVTWHCSSYYTTWTADFDMAAVLSYCDYQTAKTTPVDERNLYGEEPRVISSYHVVNEITTSGQAALVTTRRDILPIPIDIVCPITLTAFRAAGTVGYRCLIDYVIMPSSKDEIIEIAARQGLVMEV